MARVGQCRLNSEGVAAVQKKFRSGRWVNIAAFCSHIGIPRSTYYELIGRNVWFEQATIEDKLDAIGIAQADQEKFCEFKDREQEALLKRTHSRQAVPNNLPLQSTSFIGRLREMEEVKSLLQQTRLLTLLGTGGCGKTRLSLQVAANLLEAYPDGIWQIELASLTDPSLVPQTLATALGLREQPGQPLIQTLTDYLRTKTMLLLLDNCEHLLLSCARLADSLLRTCPTVKLLVTSREALNIAGEVVWRVPSLLPPEGSLLLGEERGVASALLDSDAVRLFVDRARSQRPDFVSTLQNGPIIAEVCRRLDGIPLAIELAAARTRALTLEQLSARLDQRFHLLAGGNRTASPRQQTLRALIDWSYDLLEAAEKTLLGRLSVFAGGWTLEAAVTVCEGEGIADWEVLDLLTSLTDKSLVVFGERSDEGRYRLLESIRQYAQERLLETADFEVWRVRHRDYLLMLAEEANSKLKGSEQAHWLAVLEEEHANLRQALIFCREEAEGEKGLRLGAALQQFWSIRGHLSEGRENLAAVLAHPGGSSHSRARAGALSAAGNLALEQGDYASARSLQEESLTILRELGSRQGIANSLNGLGNVAYRQGDYASARSLYEESVTIWRELGEKWGIAASLNNQGLVAFDQGDYASAHSLQEESLTIFRELGDRFSIANSLLNLGNVAKEQGDFVSARLLQEESLTILRELGNRHGIANSLLNLGNVAKEQGDYASAHSLYEESLTILRELEDKTGIASVLGNLGHVAYYQGDYALARSLQEESLAIGRELGDRYAIANCLIHLGNVAKEQGDYTAARSLYEESLTIWRELENRHGVVELLEAFAALAVDVGQMERAVEGWGATEVLRQVIGVPRSPKDHESRDSSLATAQEALGEEAFMATLAVGQAMNWEQAISCALELPGGK